ncbi:MAG: esterase [Candidatus Thermofonsia Clade 1 bacterium]|uniref:Esterase n=1 Tax=Candidatus Thermofonsia Clade 1 bacterium TaxID=2364210 RepID=A0A2M8PAH7_9CHLR|nr:MAG: esterase [Candidatus Thermofonsia Clade 1 bacterium]
MAEHFIYLHGFASSPASSKAQAFKARFAERGIPLHVPDLNVPSFERLTLTAMIEAVAALIRSLPYGAVNLIGSSMGGAVALHLADRRKDAEGKQVARLLLLAPALDFHANRINQLTEEGVRAWRESGWLNVFHHGEKAEKRVHYGLMEDMLTYDSFAVQLRQPILIYHGVHDESVDYRQSVRFAEKRPNVALRLVESDHQLLDQVDTIWSEAIQFFNL